MAGALTHLRYHRQDVPVTLVDLAARDIAGAGLRHRVAYFAATAHLLRQPAMP